VREKVLGHGGLGPNHEKPRGREKREAEREREERKAEREEREARLGLAEPKSSTMVAVMSGVSETELELGHGGLGR
jgi:hypothetical protein